MSDSEYNGVDIYPSDSIRQETPVRFLIGCGIAAVLLGAITLVFKYVDMSPTKVSTTKKALMVTSEIKSPPVTYKTIPSAVCYLPDPTAIVFTVGKNYVTKIELRAYPTRMIITRAVNEETIKRNIPTTVIYPSASIPCFYSEVTVIDRGGK